VSQAIAIASDMIRIGRAERMIVVAGDNASSDTLLPWLGNGFLALGAATIQVSHFWQHILVHCTRPYE
jgi:3-oxoacyl-(acyl-carrier-protein) synthase